MLSIDEIRNWYRDHPDKHLDLQSADLRGVNLRGVNLQGADLQGVNLRFADLQGANLENADLQGANLRNAALASANLQGTKLRFANLRFANLSRVDLRFAALASANLQGADLRFADLWGADLRFADLQGADLVSADLQGADLVSADLRHVTGITVLDVVDPRGGVCYAQVRDGVTMIGAGCRLFTVEQALDHWGVTYQGDRETGDMYIRAITAFGEGKLDHREWKEELKANRSWVVNHPVLASLGLSSATIVLEFLVIILVVRALGL